MFSQKLEAGWVVLITKNLEGYGLDEKQVDKGRKFWPSQVGMIWRVSALGVESVLFTRMLIQSLS